MEIVFPLSFGLAMSGDRWYYATMNKFFFSLFLLSALCLHLVRADERTDRLIDGLLQVGVHALKAEQERRSEASTYDDGNAEQAGEVPAVESQPKKRTWRDRGREAVSTLITGTADGLGDKPLSEVLAGAVKGAVDQLINEYKEQYKQEGREYAQEVGDKIVTRVINDPKISNSIYSLQALCWGVILYLTLVTVIVVISLLHLKRTNNKLLAAVDELKAALKRD